MLKKEHSFKECVFLKLLYCYHLFLGIRWSHTAEKVILGSLISLSNVTAGYSQLIENDSGSVLMATLGFSQKEK